MFERDNRENGDQALLEGRRSEAAPLRGKGEPDDPDADESVRLRAPARPAQPFEGDADLAGRQRPASNTRARCTG